MLAMIITILAVIPVTAIVSNAWLKNQALKARAGLSAEEKEAFKQMMAENQELKARVENLETMIADIDLEALKSSQKSRTLE